MSHYDHPEVLAETPVIEQNEWGDTTEQWESPSGRSWRCRNIDRHSGLPIREEYLFDTGGPVLAELSRLDGPARIEYRQDGTVELLAYFRNGERHRLDGPAVSRLSPSGEVTKTAFHLDGILLLDLAEVADATAIYSTERLLVEMRYSSYGVLLDEGFDAREVMTAVSSGVTTVEGIREALSGAPAEWVTAWEASS